MLTHFHLEKTDSVYITVESVVDQSVSDPVYCDLYENYLASLRGLVSIMIFYSEEKSVGSIYENEFLCSYIKSLVDLAKLHRLNFSFSFEDSSEDLQHYATSELLPLMNRYKLAG